MITVTRCCIADDFERKKLLQQQKERRKGRVQKAIIRALIRFTRKFELHLSQQYERILITEKITITIISIY